MNLDVAYLILGIALLCSLIVGIVISFFERKKKMESDEPILLRILEATQKINLADLSTGDNNSKVDNDDPTIVKDYSMEDPL